MVQLASPLLLLLQLTSLADTASAQSGNKVDGECSCSPRTFSFKLDLFADCPPLPPPYPPNDVFDAGVKDYTCTIGPEPIPTTQQVTSEDMDIEDEPPSRMRRRRLQSGGVGQEYTRAAADFFPELIAPKTAADYFPELLLEPLQELEAELLEQQEQEATDLVILEELEWSSVNFTASQVTLEDVIPIEIYSIQFLEVDTSFNVINQDSSFVRGIDFRDGDVFSYTSISAIEPGVIPGGMNMVLRGVNAEGDPIRNVFTITYTNDCGVQTFGEGDAIGWVIFVSVLLLCILVVHTSWCVCQHVLTLIGYLACCMLFSFVFCKTSTGEL